MYIYGTFSRNFVILQKSNIIPTTGTKFDRDFLSLFLNLESEIQENRRMCVRQMLQKAAEYFYIIYTTYRLHILFIF